MHAGPNDFNKMAAVLHSRYKNENHIVFQSKNNKSGQTHVGIEQLGIWFAEEVVACLRQHDMQLRGIKSGKKHLFSFLGHSLGGLIVRHSLALLYGEDLPIDYPFRTIFDQRYRDILEPTSFFTLSCPHLGCRRNNGGIKRSAWRASIHAFLKFFGKTGTQMRLADHLKNRSVKIEDTCILQRMAEPDSPFMHALCKFKFRTVLATTHHDVSVPFCSGSIRTVNPYPEASRGKPDFRIVGYSNFDRDYERVFERHLQFEAHSDVVIGPPIGEQSIRVHEGDVLKNDSAVYRYVSEEGIVSYGSDLKGTEFDETAGEQLEHYMHDEKRQMTFLTDMVSNLHKLSWRRIDVEFRFRDHLEQLFVHILPIGSTKNLTHTKVLRELSMAGARCVDAGVSMLELDHKKMLQSMMQEETQL
ncbi:lipase [Acrasis kona]|uniref:Lipase n=1 Tax=Acrasis kona TaxID=1008807 RepID=A0AAW2ZP56_9EUKA